MSSGNQRETSMSTSGAAPAPLLTEAELKLLQALVYQECGMHFDERRTHFLEDRLLRRLKECRADSFYAYYRLLISREGKDELAKLLENLTVNETSFFRGTRPNWICFRSTCWRNCSNRKARGANIRSASGARAAPPARSLSPWPCWSPTRWHITTCAIRCRWSCRCPSR
ncbi:hypothetical protein SBA1_430006 [Candidatus Sulfotelmatobacter kueseliae]|uniref:CheR-type methyltransferase domain-containing protein n=1 Tax=Candidatus Sulfotelmatobacter kueseliae TaxID=2042962 RepID=A0A2U3KRB5_9BACT|nr:hypothetical protein SBA1_430006 [Candidatus Sulfotelmatobacter kueseliae]